MIQNKSRRYAFGLYVLAFSTTLPAVGFAKEKPGPHRPLQSTELEVGRASVNAGRNLNHTKQDAEERAFNKRATELKRATSGICSNC
jgi:hypothetical protein